MQTISLQRLSTDPVELRKLENALTTIGFFYISETDLDTRAISQASADLFAMPLISKQQAHLSKSSNYRGWSGLDEEVTLRIPDHKETFDFGISQEAILNPNERYQRMRGLNQYPPGTPDHVIHAVDEYIRDMCDIGLKLMKAIGQVIGQKLDFEDPFAILRLINYPAGANRQGVGQHSDYGFLTLIHQDAKGLQALSLQNQWIDIDPIPDTFVVNIGDALAEVSNNLLRATPHRVNNPSSGSRNSVAFFYEPALDAKIVNNEPYGKYLLKAYERSYPTM